MVYIYIYIYMTRYMICTITCIDAMSYSAFDTPAAASMCLEKPLGLNLNRIEQWGLAGFQSWHLVVDLVDITDIFSRLPQFQSISRPTLSPTLELWISWTSQGVPAMAIPCFGDDYLLPTISRLRLRTWHLQIMNMFS